MDFNLLLSILFKHISIISYDQYSFKINESKIVLESIDQDDAPFLALALSVQSDGIWSDDKALKLQSRVRVYNTREILDLLGLN